MVNGEVDSYIVSGGSRGEELSDGSARIDGAVLATSIDGSASIDGGADIDGYIGITCPNEPLFLLLRCSE